MRLSWVEEGGRRKEKGREEEEGGGRGKKGRFRPCWPFSWGRDILRGGDEGVICGTSFEILRSFVAGGREAPSKTRKKEGKPSSFR